MFDRDLWREIFQSINMNRTRSVLSGFTVAFAILLFTILFGIANGLNNTFAEAFADDANNSIFIQSGTTTKAHKGYQAGRQIQFKNKDYDYIKEEYGDKVQYITSRLYLNVNASFRNEKNTYNVRAVHPDHQYLENTKMKEGRYINQLDLDNRSKVVVIGRLVEEDLFLKTTALGKYLSLNGLQYKIVGIFTDDGGDNEERLIYMPISTAQRVYGNNDYIDQINLTYNPEMNYDKAIAFSNSLTKDLKDRFDVASSDQRAIRVRNLANESKTVNQMTFGLGVIIIVIGFGTLIAGVVGVSNIMIFIVKERTKEIGIRKALGASPKSIISIILMESILITAIAGYVGLLIGMGVLEFIGPSLETYFIKDPSVSTTLVIGATITLIIAGGIAGYLPAKKASQIKPIVALRDD
ncbi:MULTISPECIES: ABC transporter permease [Xanthomarina]|jgi:putative ABC transport system permease protein|uniref:ABC transporter permease n=2 Tax=Xanthomarina gelatinilytica TaxID=1137281 RepID=A0A3D6BSP1_9FLAO|nr:MULTISPECIES: ABC transporter permease [Xanthomarina]MBF61277.1 ABC transporter permease [Xanthomarina sp.]HAB26842.1 ABC transporter permease [Xanthomarina gelatinilytica]HCY81055.1 ABC transporter permease [Xanthomarina gelatinilytica]